MSIRSDQTEIFKAPTTRVSLGSLEKPLSISEITDMVKRDLETTFPEVVITGEISNCKVHPSGHCYFSLKDDKAFISAVMFRHDFQKIKFKLNDGMKAIGIGKISVYAARGSYQVIFSRIEPDGVGALQIAFEQMKKRLEAEGLFAAERKRALPKFPTKVGVVTSSSGAAIRDILQILNRRFSGLHVMIYPVKVQGPGSAEEVALAIRELNLFYPEIEVMIVGRGGGSIEDLWAFNEEVVARAIYLSKIPIISAVGHEVDFTIADFVADLRAPTPSAAAELVISSKLETILHIDHLVKRLLQVRRRLEFAEMKVDDLLQRLTRSLEQKISSSALRLERMKGSLTRQSPFARIEAYRSRLHRSSELLQRIPPQLLQKSQWKVEYLHSKLKLLNPKAIMERGYSIVRLETSKKVVTKVSDVRMGDKLVIEFAKGKITAKV